MPKAMTYPACSRIGTVLANVICGVASETFSAGSHLALIENAAPKGTTLSISGQGELQLVWMYVEISVVIH